MYNVYIIYKSGRGLHNTTWLFACGPRAARWRLMTWR